MNELSGKHIVLGLTGGIACYKAAELCRALVKEGASVQVVMTEAAEHFITPVTMQALSNRPVYGSQWDAREPNNMAHINLGREADAILIAPASADFMAKLLHGRADELLSLLCLARPAATVPLIGAPAMNREMWANPATRRNVAQLRADGIEVLDVGQGEQACGETGDGRMLEADEILADLVAFFSPKRLAGRQVLVTAGPTYEVIATGGGMTSGCKPGGVLVLGSALRSRIELLGSEHPGRWCVGSARWFFSGSYREEVRCSRRKRDARPRT